jgi:translation factor GUF1, mitochondrial
LIDSWFLKDKGVVMLIEIKQGVIKRGDVITSCAFDRKYDVFEVGIMHPEFLPQKELTTGMVGYVLTNMKSS